MTQLKTSGRYAVIGNPIAHSRSPFIHARFAEQAGIALVYERLLAPLDGFETAVSNFFGTGGRGLNVTVPFKQAAWTLAAAGLSERARHAGSVNTLWLEQNTLHGCNTDGIGLITDLARQGITLPGTRILLIGAGGAARGVIGPLLAAGCAALHVVNRNAERARELLQPHIPALTAGALADAAQAGPWNIVVNATSTGLTGEAPALPPRLYAADALAYDMFYAPQPTPFMRQAKRDGAARTADGLGMLVGQAAESFRLWHGRSVRIEPVLTALRAELDAQTPA